MSVKTRRQPRQRGRGGGVCAPRARAGSSGERVQEAHEEVPGYEDDDAVAGGRLGVAGDDLRGGGGCSRAAQDV